MLFQRRDGSPDVFGIIAEDLNRDSLRQHALHRRELGLYGRDHFQRVGAKLALHVERDGLFAMYEIPGGLLGIAVFHMADVADANRRSIDVGGDDVVEIAGLFHARQRAHAQFPIATPNRAARHLDVFVLNGALELPDGEAIAVQFLGVGKGADLPQTAPGQVHRADAVHSFECAPNDLIGKLGGLPQAPAARHENRKDRRLIGIDLGDHGRQHVGRQIAHGRGHALANILRRAVQIAFQREFAADARAAFIGLCGELIHAAHAADGLFQRQNDLRIQLFGRASREIHAYVDRGGIGARKQIHSQVAEGENSQHD